MPSAASKLPGIRVELITAAAVMKNRDRVSMGFILLGVGNTQVRIKPASAIGKLEKIEHQIQFY
jgi:hypothetical protein